MAEYLVSDDEEEMWKLLQGGFAAERAAGRGGPARSGAGSRTVGRESGSLGYCSNLCGPSTDTLAARARYAEAAATPAMISRAVGGTWGSIAFGEPFGKCLGRGDRRACLGFSRSSRRAMVRFLGQIPHQETLAVCLTYPATFPTPREAKVDLRNFIHRLTRAWGKPGVVWKLEPQKRLAPHFHLLVQLRQKGPVERKMFANWLRDTWHEVAGRGVKAHAKYGCDVTVVTSREHYGAYAAKYAAKEQWDQGFSVDDDGVLVELPAEWQEAGRWWGVENRASWGVNVESVPCDEGHARHVDRTLRRYLEAAARWAARVCVEPKKKRRLVKRVLRVRKLVRRKRPACSRTLLVSAEAVRLAVESYPACLVSAGEGQARVVRVPGRVDPDYWRRRCALQFLADCWEREGYTVRWGENGPEVELVECEAA